MQVHICCMLLMCQVVGMVGQKVKKRGGAGKPHPAGENHIDEKSIQTSSSTHPECQMTEIHM